NPPKRTLLRQGYGGYPPRIHPRVYTRGFVRRRVTGLSSYYAAPVSCATSDLSRWIKSASGVGGKFSPPRRRGARVSAVTSLSPMTTAYGIFANCASRIL